MLSQQQLLATAPRRRPLRSLRQQYDLYIMDRVEQFKNRISREELMRLADEAVSDVRGADVDQFLLTEVLAQEAVDELIKRRLGVRSFDAWRKSYPKRRNSQREPIYWNLDEAHLVAGLAPRIEAGDPVLVVGVGAEHCAYLLAAHDADVTFLDRDFSVVERAEGRVADESLSSTFDAICVQFGQWLPCIPGEFVLVIIDAGTLGVLSPGERRILLEELQSLTSPGGLHALVPDAQGAGPEGFAGHYASWARETLPPSGRRIRGGASRGALFCKPAAARTESGRRDVRA
ncbi:MAG: class I SAM-dependent methyltransferase [Gemmatimonadales bacterium]|jgi:hypothetical protein|nr:class I SAM-dependent methyltransferase [Gemmatimonadales bacterium]